MIWILSNLVNHLEIIFDKTNVLEKIIIGRAVMICMAALIITFIFSSRKYFVLLFRNAVGSEEAELKIVEHEIKKNRTADSANSCGNIRKQCQNSNTLGTLFLE